MAPERKRILIVDSDPDVLIALEKLTEDAGYESRTVWNTDQAVDILKDHDFDLILISDHFPEIHCTRILDEANSLKLPVPCIGMLSARSPQFAEKYLANLGMAEAVRKWRFDELLGAIDRQIGAISRPSKRAIAG